jgi:hypothetical protein
VPRTLSSGVRTPRRLCYGPELDPGTLRLVHLLCVAPRTGARPGRGPSRATRRRIPQPRYLHACKPQLAAHAPDSSSSTSSRALSPIFSEAEPVVVQFSAPLPSSVARLPSSVARLPNSPNSPPRASLAPPGHSFPSPVSPQPYHTTAGLPDRADAGHRQPRRAVQRRHTVGTHRLRSKPVQYPKAACEGTNRL